MGTRERIQVRPQAMLEAKDLPTNHLSNLLEQKVAQALVTDRQQRAAQQVRTTVLPQDKRGRAALLSWRVTLPVLVERGFHVCAARVQALAEDGRRSGFDAAGPHIAVP